MQLQAWERWLDEGWSPWRIAYGSVALVATGVAAYGYVSHPHHPGAVWWLLIGAIVLALWASSETVRWRIRYRRLLARPQARADAVVGHGTQQVVFAASEAFRTAQMNLSTAQDQRIRKLCEEGESLQDSIGQYRRRQIFLPDPVRDMVSAWDSSIRSTRAISPEVRAELENMPKLDPFKPLRAGTAYDRLDKELKILKNVLKPGF